METYSPPLPHVTPACFGVACPRHERCARYAAVNQTQADPSTRATCLDRGTFPLFVPSPLPREAAEV